MEKTAVFESRSVSSHDLEIAQARDYYIVQHNDLVQKQRYQLDRNGGSSLTLTEEKILAYMISQIKPEAETLEPLTFDIKTFCEVCGLPTGPGVNFYNQLKAVITKLAGRVLWLSDRQSGEETTVRYIDRAIMHKGKGQVKIKLDELLGPYLLNLAGNYFQFSYHNILAMKSKYGIQLYKLLKSYAFTGRHEFYTDDLKRQLMAEHYKNFKDFRIYVIERAVKEINLYTDLEVSWEPEYYGRKVEKVIFHIKQRDTWGQIEAANRADKALDDQIPGQMSIYDYFQ